MVKIDFLKAQAKGKSLQLQHVLNMYKGQGIRFVLSIVKKINT